ncbi:hypothetical protein CTI12_AA400280 [Artemisia annua]|uniref:Uncharacterized protein n=1 Tax=Artemisia annua TaxID=35608 RepID=A0A2U1MAZ7_ARTAN|nr:hypothetical protein CTI12_AA400280 [Artemisia annua]
MKSTGCNILLMQKSVLNDAVTDLLSLYLTKAKMLVIKDVERHDIKFITNTLNCLPIVNIEYFHLQKPWFADIVEEVSCGDENIVKITGIKNMTNTTNVVIHG